MADAPVLILPGLYDSGPEHWQTRWELAHPGLRRVGQDDWEQPLCADWVARLEDATLRTPDAVLVAHSSACALVAHWVASGAKGRARAALLVGPSDPEAESYPRGPVGFAPMPLVRLPFPSVVVASTDDPFVTVERATGFATAWGSKLILIERAGHLNAASGLGDWPAGYALLEELR